MAVLGFQELLMKLDESNVPRKLQKNIIVRSLRKASEPMEDRMGELAPDDPTTPRQHIKEAMMTSVVNQTYTGAVARIGPSRAAFDASFHEWGTINEPARPFVGPAFEQSKAQALERLGDELAERIEEAMTGQSIG